MRVLIVSCVFPPEPVASARTSADLAEALVERGHAVAVITAFPSRPGGQLYAGYRRRLFHTERHARGYRVIRCFAFISAESRLFSRFAENISFGLTSSLAVLAAERPAVIYANSWPLFATGLLACAARLRNIPLVVSVQDLYPESLIAQARLPARGVLARTLRALDRLVAGASRAIIVISEAFADIYRTTRGSDPAHLYVIPNWIADDEIVPDDGRAQLFRPQSGLARAGFLLAYGGNIGMAADVETVIAAVGRLPTGEAIGLLVAGEGSQLARCRLMAAEQAPQRVWFRSPWPADETSAVLAAADVLILPTRGRQSLVSVPSKLLTYMLAARPVIALAMPDTDIAHLVERAGCGWLVAPGDAEALACKIREISRLPGDVLRQMGRAGRAYAKAHLTREVCLPRAIAVLEQAGD